MASKTDEKCVNGQIATEPSDSKLFLSDPRNSLDVSGSVMDGLVLDVNGSTYKVYKARWVMLAFFVVYSASNSLQWTQYTIINDIVVKYYDVPSTLVSWTSMVYMVTYVPLIFPASWLLDKTRQVALLQRWVRDLVAQKVLLARVVRQLDDDVSARLLLDDDVSARLLLDDDVSARLLLERRRRVSTPLRQ